MTDREHQDVAPQRQAADAGREELRDALDALAAGAKRAKRSLGVEDIADLYGLVDAVRRADRIHDLAVLDLATASGEDA